eukprot:TRINITY_DN111837_c0_g1_i1.p1 TRINITY_DN111837_c0_g1~~TRINITY_DN111837_c0_g1_i1.p1  ORF type:complete len:487 (+),score=75.70 TRINITY_DN111837_c0_g1_i1:102-1562(+)
MIDYEPQDWLISLICRRRGSVFGSGLIIAVPSALLAVLLSFAGQYVEALGDAEETFSASQLWSALTTSLVVVISVRTSKAHNRFWEGATLLHTARGEWWDAASNLVAFTTLSKDKKPKEVLQFRQTLVRLMSLIHSSALQEVTEHGENIMYECMDLGGLDQETLGYLREAKTTLRFNRVEVIVHMLQVLIVRNFESGVIDIPAPILTRFYETLARGQVDVMNAKKISNTMFPFPYAQLIAVLLCALAASTPMLMSAIISSPFWAAFFSFIPVFSLVALNATAMQLEMPFGQDVNDLPLDEFAQSMNNGLQMLLHEQIDHVARLDPDCALSMVEHQKRLSTLRVRECLPEHDGAFRPSRMYVSRNDWEWAAQSGTPGEEGPAGPPAAPAQLGPASAALAELKEYAKVVETLLGSVRSLDSTLQGLCQSAEHMTELSSTVVSSEPQTPAELTDSPKLQASQPRAGGEHVVVSSTGPGAVMKSRLASST